MALFATLLVLAMLVSGTRILILFVVPVIVTAAVASGHRRLRFVSLFVVAAITLTLLAGIVSNTAAAGYFNFDVVQARLAGVIPLLTSQDVTADASLYARYLQTNTLQQAWLQNPLFGLGPGALYSYSSVVDTRPVDSPLAILSRFGVIGAAAILVLFATLFASRLRRGAHWVPATALLAFISLIAVWSLVSSPLDDKGVALGLIPLIGLCGLWRKEAQPPAPVESG
jgi:O-antigen ligase